MRVRNFESRLCLAGACSDSPFFWLLNRPPSPQPRRLRFGNRPRTAASRILIFGRASLSWVTGCSIWQSDDSLSIDSRSRPGWMLDH